MTYIGNALWAKKKPGDLTNKWLPLDQHLVDTRNTGGFLWNHWLSEGQKLRINEDLGFMDMEDSMRVFKLLCQIHDVGKATYDFQTTKTFFSTDDLENDLKEKLYRVGFKDLEKKLSYPYASPHGLAGQMILQWKGFGEDFSSIIGSHHGRPANRGEIREQKSFLSNYYRTNKKDDPDYILWKKAQDQLIEKALKDNGFKGLDELPHIGKHSQIIFSGLLIMADWIASNEDYFPLIDINSSHVENPDKRIEVGLEKWKKTELWKAEDIYELENNKGENIYKLRFDFDPREPQEKFKELIENTDNPGLFIFEAPMGMGKTEAALVGVEALAYKTSRSGMFFGLPTQATSNGIFPRIKDWVEELDHDKHGIRLAHGKASLNEDFTSLATNINVDQSEKLSNQSVLINEWFSGRKRTSLDDFVIGTVDQFLLMALKQKHVALRHLGFDKKVVVIDEVHAYDTYMDQYLLEALRWLGSYEIPVILLSATLPAKKREEMLMAYLKGKGERSRDLKDKVKVLDKKSYPLISFTDGNDIGQVTDFEKVKNKEVKIIKNYSDQIFPILKNLWENDGVIGVMVNTVKRAQDLALECCQAFGDDSVELLHSSFISTHRRDKEKDLIESIGKKGRRPKKKIIIGTQVIEQSLDIDFDVLVTDLAPMDLMIQRIGRLHRHDINRPKAYETPLVYVTGLNQEFDFEQGSVAVYGAYMLSRSQYYLPEKIRIPDDISDLVQKVYSHDKLNLDEDLLEKYENFKKEDENFKEKKKRRAKQFLLKEIMTQREKSMVDWLNGDAILKTEEKANAQVRDSRETIEVIALKKNGQGYGLFGEDKDLSSSIGESQVAKKIANNTLKLPTILSMNFNIDKTIDELEAYNLENLALWQDQTWLKGSLGIIFDENNDFSLGDFTLHYSEKYGLSLRKEEGSD